jgi:hypothetical protein
MIESVLRKPGKVRPFRFALFVFAVCLVAGCLHPSSISEEERTFQIGQASPTETESAKKALTQKTYLIDTGLYQVGDSWEYESVKKEVGSLRVSSKTQERFTLISKSVAAVDRIGFEMEIFRFKVEFDSDGVPVQSVYTQTRMNYNQSAFGLMGESINLVAPDTNELIQPGQFPAFEHWKEAESRCGLESANLLCKNLRYNYTYNTPAGSPCYGHCQSPIYSNMIQAVYTRSSGLIWLKVAYRVPGMPPDKVCRLVAHNGVPVPEITIPDP